MYVYSEINISKYKNFIYFVVVCNLFIKFFINYLQPEKEMYKEGIEFILLWNLGSVPNKYLFIECFL